MVIVGDGGVDEEEKLRPRLCGATQRSASRRPRLPSVRIARRLDAAFRVSGSRRGMGDSERAANATKVQHLVFPTTTTTCIRKHEERADHASQDLRASEARQ